MTDVTAQAFREAAALPGIGDLFRRLLLAAAEQREALDKAHEQIGVLHADNYNLSEQIATLTEERDEARTLARQAVNGWACYATRKIEHDDIARIHRVLDAMEAKCLT